MRARRGFLASAVWLLIAIPAPFAAAQSAPVVHVELSSLDLRRHVELVAAGADLIHAATEFGLARTFETVSTSADRRGRIFRLSKLYVVDLPTVALAHTIGHEFGHDSRRRERGSLNNGFALQNWPWPVPFVDAHGTGGPVPAGGFLDSESIATTSGGYEAGRVRDRRFEDAFSTGEAIDHFLASQLIYSRLEEPLAVVFYLRESRLRDEKLFLFSDKPGRLAIDDPSAYALTFTNIRYRSISFGNAEAAARSIRSSARWALADLQLAGSVYRVADYLWTGNRFGKVPAIKIKGTRFWPRATFALTSAGISRGGELLAVRDKISIGVRAEKTEQAVPLDVVGQTDRGRPILAERTPSLWGGGVSVSATVKATRLRLEGNAWHQATTGRGGSAEARVERSVPGLPARTIASASLGFKTAGFLAGAPDAARWFASVGMTIRR